MVSLFYRKKRWSRIWHDAECWEPK